LQNAKLNFSKTKTQVAGMWKKIVSLCCMFWCAFSILAHPGIHEQVEQLNERLKKQPTYQLYAQRAHLYFESGQIDLAFKDLEIASKMGPKEPLLFEYGNVYLAKNQYEKALKHFNQFIKFNNKLPEVFLARAKALQQLGRSEEAIEDIKHSLQMHPSPHPGLYIEAANLAALNKKDPLESALNLLDEGIQKIGVQGQLQERVIELLMNQNRQPEALARMVLLGKERNHNIFWRHDYALLLVKSDKSTEAQAELKRALKESRGMSSPAVQELRLKIEQQLSQIKK
jgi:tetratricopeptide (TPR) repeat protein